MNYYYQIPLWTLEEEGGGEISSDEAVVSNGPLAEKNPLQITKKKIKTINTMNSNSSKPKFTATILMEVRDILNFCNKSEIYFISKPHNITQIYFKD